MPTTSACTKAPPPSLNAPPLAPNPSTRGTTATEPPARTTLGTPGCGSGVLPGRRVRDTALGDARGGGGMGVSERIDTFQRRHRWAALPVAVGYKFIDDEGVYLAALLSYYGFLSLFPLLLLAVTILGFVLRDDPAAQQAV